MNERVTNEQAKDAINTPIEEHDKGKDLIRLVKDYAADLLDARLQRDTAWRELREIREAIKADENESTADEVRSLIVKSGKLLVALEKAANQMAQMERMLDRDVEFQEDLKDIRETLEATRRRES